MKTQNEVKHTPTPWMIDDQHDREPRMTKIVPVGSFIGVAAVFGDTDQEAEVNAAFIVRAANNHEALLHACRRAFYLIKEGGFTHPMTEEFYDDTLYRLEKAITESGGALTNPGDGE